MSQMGRSDRVVGSDASIYVRSTPNTDSKFDASVPVAKCQQPTAHLAIEHVAWGDPSG